MNPTVSIHVICHQCQATLEHVKVQASIKPSTWLQDMKWVYLASGQSTDWYCPICLPGLS